MQSVNRAHAFRPLPSNHIPVRFSLGPSLSGMGSLFFLRRSYGGNRSTPLFGESVRVLPQLGHSNRWAELVRKRSRSMETTTENVHLDVMECFNDQSVQDTWIPFTTLKNSIPDGERLSQEILSQCAGLGASVRVSGQKPSRFQIIYQHIQYYAEPSPCHPEPSTCHPEPSPCHPERSEGSLPSYYKKPRST